MDRTLIIEGMAPTTFARLEAAAHDRGLDPAALARSLLEKSIESIPSACHDLDSLAGTWSDDEAKAFENATAAMRSVDPESWR